MTDLNESTNKWGAIKRNPVAAIQNRATSANKKGPRKIAKIDQIYENYCYFKK